MRSKFEQNFVMHVPVNDPNIGPIADRFASHFEKFVQIIPTRRILRLVLIFYILKCIQCYMLILEWHSVERIAYLRQGR